MSTPIQHDSLDPKSLQYYLPRKLRSNISDPPPIQPFAEPSSHSLRQAIVVRPLDPDNALALTEALPDALRKLIENEYKTRVRRPIRKRPIAILAVIAAAAGIAVGVATIGTGGDGRDKTKPPNKDAELSLAERLQSATAALKQTPQKTMAPTLTVKDVSGDSNAGLPLGIDVTNYTPGAAVFLSGLLAGAAISAGNAAGEGGWHIAVDDLAKARVIPPPNYVGPMTVVAELQGGNGQAIVRSPIHYSWKQVVAAAAKAPERPAAAPAKVAAVSGDDSPALRRIEPAEAAALLNRAEELVASGDLPAARLLLHRVAEAHNARAAYALGASYDPSVIKKLGSVSAPPDLALARTWYQRASDWGSPEASKQLHALASADK